MADNKVTLEMEVDASKATKEIKDFGNQAEMALKGVPESANKAANSIETIGNSSKEAGAKVSDFGSRVGSIVAGLAVFETLKGVFSSLSGFLGEAVQGAAESEVAFNQLSQSLVRAGTYTQENVASFQAYAAELSKLSSLDDDVIVGQLAIARNFAQTDEQAKKLVSAAADLSRAMGIDFETAVELLGRTLDGTAGRLNETVPAMRGLSEESLKAGGAIELVSQQFGGAALAHVSTYQGAIAQLSIQWGNFSETVGDIIVSNAGLAAGINEVAKIVIGLTDDVAENKRGMQSLLNEGIISLLSGIRAILPFINIFSSVVVVLSQAFYDLFKMIKDGWTAIADFIGGIATLGKNWQAFSDLVKDPLDWNLGAFDTKSVDNSIAKIQDAIKNADLQAQVGVKVNVDPKSLKGLKTGVTVKQGPETSANEQKDSTTKDSPINSSGSMKYDPDSEFGPFKEAYKFDPNFEQYTPPPDTEFYPKTITIFGPFKVEGDSPFGPYSDGLKTGEQDSEYGPYKGGYQLDPSAVGKPDFTVLGALNKTMSDLSTVYKVSSDTISAGADWASEKIANFVSPTGKATDKEKSSVKETAKETLIAPAKAAIAGAVAGIGAGITSTIANIAGGQEGAATAVADTLSASVGGALDSLFSSGGMFTDAIKGILDLAKDPEAIAGMVEGFVSAIPTIVQNFVSAIPTIIQGIVAALPSLFQAVITLIPVLFQALADAIPSLFVTIGTYLPDLIVVLAESIPILVEAIADNADIIIMKLIAAVPRVATALAFAVVNVAFTLVTKLIPNVIKGISDGIGAWFKGAGNDFSQFISTTFDLWVIKPLYYSFIKPLEDLGKFFQSLMEGGKGGPRFLTNTKEEVGSWFGVKLATGGVVPNGFPSDSYPASLSSGELVLPPKTTGNLFSLIDGMANGEAPSGNNNETNNLLRQLIALIASQSTEVNVQLDRNTLAKAILTLNKDNRRLA